MPEDNNERIYVIDGSRFHDYSGLRTEFNNVVLANFDLKWNGGLDAFNDFLSWPDGPWIMVWKNSELSRRNLGYDAMAKLWERFLTTCHPTNVVSMTEKLKAAQNGQGQTLFDLIVEIIQDNSDYVTLRLE